MKKSFKKISHRKIDLVTTSDFDMTQSAVF